MEPDKDCECESLWSQKGEAEARNPSQRSAASVEALSSDAVVLVLMVMLVEGRVKATVVKVNDVQR